VTGSMERLCATSDVPAGTVVRVETCSGIPVAVVRTASGGFHAVLDRCSHEDVPLSEGEVCDATVECWLHGSRFDLGTGKPSALPATRPVPVYPVEIRDGDVYVDVNSSNGVNS
jgi:3-phenylpropionate/trans-cinnamate dioxygenase ferredoxin subunit